MVYPLVANDDGIKMMPEHMEDEKLYHCIFGKKVMLLYRDNQQVLHCYEIEEKNLVEQIRQCGDNEMIAKILEDYIADRNLK